VNRAATILAAAALGGCGSAEETRSPGVRALDAPAPGAFTRQLRDLPDTLAAVPESAKKRVLLGIVPESEPRAVAELEVTGGTLRLFAWRAQKQRLCLWPAVVTPAEPLGYGGPTGPCIVPERCGRLCVTQQQLDAGTTVVAGAVDAEADTLRLVPMHAPPIELALDGPPLAGFPGWRVVLVDLGRRSYGRAELLRDGRPIATREDVEYDYATEDCLERAGDDWLKTKKCL
jgi:hypothetical protein